MYMTKLRQQFPLSSTAYRIFVDELVSHIRAVHEAVEQEELVFEEQRIAEASECCHKIKGGAGLFGLNDLAHVATRLEAAMLQPLEHLQAELSEVRELIAELERYAGELPPPEEK